MLLRVFSFSVLIYKDGSLIFTCQLQLWNIKKENARTAGTVSVMFHLLLQQWQRDLIWLSYSRSEVPIYLPSQKWKKSLGKTWKGKGSSVEKENDEGNHLMSEER